MGCEPREVTTFERDADGQVVRAVTVREPEWTDQDRGWVLALLAEQADTCGGCGQPVSECFDPKTMREWQAVERQCQACRVVEAQHEANAEASTRRRGLRVGVRRIAAQ
jgi:hypothetical protein